MTQNGLLKEEKTNPLDKWDMEWSLSRYGRRSQERWFRFPVVTVSLRVGEVVHGSLRSDLSVGL